MRYILFVLAAPLLAQDPNQRMEDIEKAHSTLIQPPVSKSKVAGNVTAELAGSLRRFRSTTSLH